MARRCAAAERRCPRPMMAERGAGDGLPAPPTDDARSPTSSPLAGAGPDWPGLALADEDDTGTDDYRRRCLLLEASLVKFKEKATRVRQLFTVKVCVVFVGAHLL